MKKTLTVIMSAAVVLSSTAALAKTEETKVSTSVRFPSFTQVNREWYSKYFCNNSFTLPGCAGEGYIPDTNTPQPEKPETIVPEVQKPDTNVPEVQKPSTDANTSVEVQVLNIVNQHRVQNGLAPLTWDDALANVARAHSEDMRDRKFFSHTNPDGRSPFDRIKNYGITYRSAGENIAAGQTTPEEVVNAWMNSPGHRANILSESYTKLGVGYAAGGPQRHYWTQNFAG